MKHEDFTSLDIENVLSTMLSHVQKAVGAKTVHWLSAHGLSRVQDSTDETWQWAFSTVDVVGKHVMSVPACDLWDTYNLWRKAAALYPLPLKGKPNPHTFESYYVLPLVYEGAFQGLLLFERLGKANPVEVYAKLKPGLDIASKYVAFSYQTLGARNMSYLDELTNLFNQRYLPLVLEHEIQRAKRDNGQFSLLFLDIDYFKMVNDGRGHWVGSKLLIELSKVLRLQVRSCDYCFRYGGDEFIVLLGGSNAENSKKVAERIRKAVESHTFSVEGHNMNLTVSIGLASYPDHAQSASELIQIADQAMYYGKRKSRNIVFVAS